MLSVVVKILDMLNVMLLYIYAFHVNVLSHFYWPFPLISLQAQALDPQGYDVFS